MKKTDYRVERDSIGVKDIPEDVYYGVQSLRAAENFHITGLNMHPEIINSLAYIKKAAAITNCEVGLLEKKKAQAIVQACDEIVSGKFHNEFIVDPVQGGAGTSLNMNANEVIANRAIEILGGKKGDYTIINPNDDVNCGQSTNDVIPTAGKMTSLRLLQNLKKQLLRLYDALNEKATEFDHIIKMGRTQMQDAVPIRLGQEFKAYSVAIMRDIHRMDKAMDEMRTLNMGGTAIGTGINADEGYLRRIVPNLTEISGMDFIQAFDLIDSTQNLDPFVAVSGAVKACAVTLSKMSNDLRLMSSGPRTGFGEINLPAKQNGSSIMPGKVNPVIPEVVNQVAFNIIGNDVTITMAAEAGQLELNAFEPIIFYCMFQSIDTLGYAVQTLVDNCIVGITANEERCRYLVENSVGIITAISPHLGYQKAADIAKKAIKTGESVRSLILKEKLMDEDELNRILDPIHMTEPGISGKDYLIKKECKKHKLNARQFKISDDAVYTLIDCYTAEAGVRGLEKKIASLCRKASVEIEKGAKSFRVTSDNIENILGPKRFLQDTISATNQIGVINGLAWTSVGGTLLPIEVTVLKGTGKIELTGNLGTVMQESAKTAVSYIRSIADKFGIKEDFYKNNDIHIHAPEAAVPKDGPSAGLAITTALFSELTKIPIRRDIAMTGEISLKGNALPIGGLKEKSMAAYKAGCCEVIIPRKNMKDIAEISDEVKASLDFKPVDKFLDILPFSLEYLPNKAEITAAKTSKPIITKETTLREMITQ